MKNINQNKIKPILPSLREKKRYIAYKVKANKPIDNSTLRNAVNSYMLKFLGELSYAKAGIILLDCKNNKGIIKTSNNYVNEVKASLALIDSIENNVVAFRSICVSGSLSKAVSKMEVI